jgi:hypothetical protein
MTRPSPWHVQEFEKHAKDNIDTIMPYGVYTLEELRSFGQARNFCPYFLARHAVCHMLYVTAAIRAF